jgi:hypothetical protein
MIVIHSFVVMDLIQYLMRSISSEARHEEDYLSLGLFVSRASAATGYL